MGHSRVSNGGSQSEDWSVWRSGISFLSDQFEDDDDDVKFWIVVGVRRVYSHSHKVVQRIFSPLLGLSILA